jgi:ribosomal protein S27E
MAMSFIQKFMTSIVPRSLAQSIEAQSRAWMAKCGTCGEERSIWDHGGIRWGAAGNPRRRLRCSRCARVTWQQLRNSQG